MVACQDILAVPAKRKAQPRVSHLTVTQTRCLLAQPDRSTRRGRRDATLLATLYDTAARVSEFADLTVHDIRLQPPALAAVDVSPHVLRHSKAMHLYEAGVPLPYIRDILGHVDLTTTEIYARASTEAKRKALEAAYTDIVTDELPEWNRDAGLLDWLAGL